MSIIHFGNISVGLTNAQIKVLHEKALYLIKNSGIRVPHNKILDLISNYDGVKIKNETVCFSEDLVEKAIKGLRFDYPDEFKKGYFMLSGAHQDIVYDIDTFRLRKTTLADLRILTKICDFLRITGSAPVRPMDKPLYLQEILMYKVSWENSSHKSNNIFEHNPKSTIESAKYIYEMSKVANKWFSIILWVISPRNFSYADLDIVYYFRDKNIPMCVTTMPVAGTTAPINMVGAYLQSIFELFSGLTLISLVNTKGCNYCAPMDNIRAYTFDMRFGTFVYGSPEDIKGTVYQANLNEYYGLPTVAKSLLTTSKEPDGQASLEKGLHTLMAMLLGIKGFTNAGLLSVDEIYSAEQLVIDKEIVDFCSKVVKDEDFLNIDEILTEIMETGPNQTFLTKESTLRQYKDFLWDPQLFTHESLGQWQKNGSMTLQKKANNKVKEILKIHDYQIDEGLKKELDKIFKTATEDQKLIDSYKNRQ